MPTLTAPDGTQLVSDAYEATAPRAAVLALHGWFDHAGRWRETGERLCAAGYSAYLLDLRGHGRSGGRPGHLSRFSQLLGDLQAFRRVVRLRTERPQVLLGLSFGGLVALRYLETQPSDPIAGAVITGPWLGLAFRPPTWKLIGGRILADLWPTLPIPARLDPDTLSRDPAVNQAYAEDAAVHSVMTPGAWREIQWAQRAVVADGYRIESPLLFLLAETTGATRCDSRPPPRPAGPIGSHATHPVSSHCARLHPRRMPDSRPDPGSACRDRVARESAGWATGPRGCGRR